jgi:hypothetical protein
VGKFFAGWFLEGWSLVDCWFEVSPERLWWRAALARAQAFFFLLGSVQLVLELPCLGPLCLVWLSAVRVPVEVVLVVGLVSVWPVLGQPDFPAGYWVMGVLVGQFLVKKWLR